MTESYIYLSMAVCVLQDRSIAVWDMQSPTEINLRRVLVGHRAAVNVVDFDDKYIVSASGDRTIKVWTKFEKLQFQCTVNSQYLEVVGTIFYKFKLPEVQINLHFG